MEDSMSGKTTATSWNIENRLIAGSKASWYSVSEPTRLAIARLRHSASYKKYEDQPLVSVCVPTYNRAGLLVERAVASVLSQTYENLELIIVGDHCTDDTEAVLSRLGDSRLRFENLPSRIRKYPQTVENHWFVGGAAPANRAMELARGKWIARIDDDDIWTPDHLEKLLVYAQSGEFEFVSSQYVAERDGKQQIIDGSRALDNYYTGKPSKPDDASPKIGGVQTWLYRSYLRFMNYNMDCWRKSWNKVWDVDLAVRIYRAGTKMGFLDEVTAYILPRPGEQTIGLEAYRQNAEQKLEHYRF
jgi:glycosyltransferase involved in cell wall biosynthesis